MLRDKFLRGEISESDFYVQHVYRRSRSCLQGVYAVGVVAMTVSAEDAVDLHVLTPRLLEDHLDVPGGVDNSATSGVAVSD